MKRKGTTLIEVTVAILIAAMTSMSVFSVVLSSSVSNVKADKKEFVAMAFKIVQERLKNYVTSDLSNSFIVGPNNWHLPGDANPNWALRAGNHDVSSLLNNNSNFIPLCRDNSGNMACSFTYNVVDTNCTGYGSHFPWGCKNVIFSLSYPD